MTRRGGWPGYLKFVGTTLVVSGGLAAVAFLVAPPSARDAVALSAMTGVAISTFASWIGGLPLVFAATIGRAGEGEAGSTLSLVIASTMLRLVAVAAVTGALLWRSDLEPGALLLAVAAIYLALLPLDVKWALDASSPDGAKSAKRRNETDAMENDRGMTQ